jgi:hypothetical protein
VEAHFPFFGCAFVCPKRVLASRVHVFALTWQTGVVFLRAETSSSRASMSLLPAGCRCTSRTRTTLSVLLDFPFVPCAFLPASSPPHPNPVWSRLPEATTYLTSLELTLKHTSRSERFKNWSSRGFTSKLPTQAGLPSLTFHLFFPGPLLSLSLSYLDRITFGFKGLNF